MIRLKTSFGSITILSAEGRITALYFSRTPEDAADAPSPVEETAAEQVSEYLTGGRRVFDLPLRLEGTSFQTAVWRELQTIPYGETRSYGEIARGIGKPGAARAVGMACNRNPIGLIIPCHRVIGASGALTGFAPGVEIKKMLLQLERRS